MWSAVTLSTAAADELERATWSPAESSTARARTDRERLLEQIERGLAEIAAGEHPPAGGVRPCAATRLVTVLLPLVPVIADRPARSPRARTARCRRTPRCRGRAPAATIGSCERHAGRHQHLRCAPSSSDRSKPPRRDVDGSRERRRARASPGGAARVSVADDRDRRASRDSASTKPRFAETDHHVWALPIIGSSTWQGRPTPARS